MKSMIKLIYGYSAITYAMLFFGVLISDTLYEEKARILCASSVTRVHVPGIMNVPTVVPWLLYLLMIAATVVCAVVLKQFTLGVGISNGIIGLYTLIVYGSVLKNFFPLSFEMPTVRSAFLVIGSYIIVLMSVVMAPIIIFSKEEDQFDRIW